MSAYGTGVVSGTVQTDNAGLQGGNIHVRSCLGGVAIEHVDKGLILNYQQARMLAGMLVALSRPEGPQP